MKGLEEQQEEGRRLVIVTDDMTPLEFNAFLLNRIADLCMRVSDLQQQAALLEKAVLAREKEKQ